MSWLATGRPPERRNASVIAVMRNSERCARNALGAHGPRSRLPYSRHRESPKPLVVVPGGGPLHEVLSVAGGDQIGDAVTIEVSHSNGIGIHFGGVVDRFLKRAVAVAQQHAYRACSGLFHG